MARRQRLDGTAEASGDPVVLHGGPMLSFAFTARSWESRRLSAHRLRHPEASAPGSALGYRPAVPTRTSVSPAGVGRVVWVWAPGTPAAPLLDPLAAGGSSGE